MAVSICVPVVVLDVADPKLWTAAVVCASIGGSSRMRSLEVHAGDGARHDVPRDMTVSRRVAEPASLVAMATGPGLGRRSPARSVSRHKSCGTLRLSSPSLPLPSLGHSVGATEFYLRESNRGGRVSLYDVSFHPARLAHIDRCILQACIALCSLASHVVCGVLPAVPCNSPTCSFSKGVNLDARSADSAAVQSATLTEDEAGECAHERHALSLRSTVNLQVAWENIA